MRVPGARVGKDWIDVTVDRRQLIVFTVIPNVIYLQFCAEYAIKTRGETRSNWLDMLLIAQINFVLIKCDFPLLRCARHCSAEIPPDARIRNQMMESNAGTRERINTSQSPRPSGERRANASTCGELILGIKSISCSAPLFGLRPPNKSEPNRGET